MPSSIDLGTLRDRVEALLEDDANAIWTDAQIDAAIRKALAKMNELRPPVLTDSVDAEAREIDISAEPVASPDGVLQVWFPYDASDANAEPTWVDFETFIYSDALYLRLLRTADPGPGQVARIVFRGLYTLDGLDSASATTFYTRDEDPLSSGAASYAVLMRSGDLNETAANMSVSTPNYAALADVWMREFLEAFTPRVVEVSAVADYGALADLFLNDPLTGFYPWLKSLRTQGQVRGEPFAGGWALDKYDSVHGWAV